MVAPRTPEQVDELFARHVNAGQLDAVVALYEPQGVLLNQDGSVAAGHRAIREVLGPLATARPDLQMHVKKVVRAGEDVAVLYNDWRITATGPDGARVAMDGKAMEIVRRQRDGSWRFVVDDPWGRS